MNKKQFAIILISTIIFAFLGGMTAVGLFQGTAVTALENSPVEKIEKKLCSDPGLGENLFLGVVEKGRFRLVVPSQPMGGFLRLTKIQMQEARPPDSAELDLKAYEGRAVLIKGHGNGGWIYRAEVAEEGSLMVSALVKQVFK
ncbi:MAG: hypothetical protein GY765_22855 [bacterium]|nr:hypothetical protein [bacterium]